jgi:N-acetylglutamate synthase-like GNAT family acetyltransferase
MEITYHFDRIPTAQQVIELYENAELPRPTGDPDRIEQMLANANLIVTAWHGDLLVGITRSITDWVWCCYLADLAVRMEYQQTGIGKKLIEHTQEKIGDLSMILLLAVPDAMNYYPKIGFTKVDSGFILPRKK